MRRARSAVTGVIAIALFVLAGSGAVVAQRASIVGTWIGETQVPNAGADTVTITVRKAEKGFAATISDSLQMIAASTEMKDVAFENNQLTGSFSLTDGATVSLKLKLDGDTLKGNWAHEGGDTGDITLQRKKM